MFLILVSLALFLPLSLAAQETQEYTDLSELFKLVQVPRGVGSVNAREEVPQPYPKEEEFSLLKKIFQLTMPSIPDKRKAEDDNGNGYEAYPTNEPERKKNRPGRKKMQLTPEQEEIRHKRRLHNNRISAQKLRERKKEEFQAQEEEFEKLKAENLFLHSIIEASPYRERLEGVISAKFQELTCLQEENQALSNIIMSRMGQSMVIEENIPQVSDES